MPRSVHFSLVLYLKLLTDYSLKCKFLEGICCIRSNSLGYPKRLPMERGENENCFICHIHKFTEYNQQWNVCSAFNPSKCTHTWSSGQPTLQRPGSSWGFSALLKGLTSVMNNSCWSWHSNPQPRVTSPTLYPLGQDCPIYSKPKGNAT